MYTNQTDKNIKSTREKQQVTYTGIPIRLSANFFSAETPGQKGVA